MNDRKFVLRKNRGITIVYNNRWALFLSGSIEKQFGIDESDDSVLLAWFKDYGK
jgi:hypothetical protein